MKKAKFPKGWNEARVRRVLECYEGQTEAEAVAQDEASTGTPGHTMMGIPTKLVPEVRRLIAGRAASRRGA